MRKDKKVLEFIGVKRSDVDEWSLPGVSNSNPQSIYIVACCLLFA